MLRCQHVPRLAVVLEIDPISIEEKRDIQKSTEGVMDWVFVAHGMSKIDNINNDNARNLRYLIPKMASLARPDDYIALIEQDVLVCKLDWFSECKKILNDNILVSAAGAKNGATVLDRRNKPKPYFSIFKSKDCDEVTEAIKTNRGSFVTINTERDKTKRLDTNIPLVVKAHAFGTKSDFWGIHARGGSNHNGRADQMLTHFAGKMPKHVIKSVLKKW